MSISPLQNHLRFFFYAINGREARPYIRDKKVTFWNSAKRLIRSNGQKWPNLWVNYKQTLLEVIQESPCKVSSFVIFACFTFNFSFLTSFDILLRASSRFCIAYVHSQYYCFQASVKSKLGLFPLSISFNQQSLRNRKSHIRYLMVLHRNICFTQLVRRRINSLSIFSTQSQVTSSRWEKIACL